jgi:uncharacterized Zn finger protein (UPF0148 family)
MGPRSTGGLLFAPCPEPDYACSTEAASVPDKGGEVAEEKCPECGEPVVEGRTNCPKCGTAYANLEEKVLERDPEEQG